MTRRFRVPAIALILSSVMAMTGSVPQDAMAGIVALSQSTGASVFQEEGPAEVRSGACSVSHPKEDVSARYWMRGIVLVVILLLILWLIYRTFTGWKPMMS